VYALKTYLTYDFGHFDGLVLVSSSLSRDFCLCFPFSRGWVLEDFAASSRGFWEDSHDDTLENTDSESDRLAEEE
jgi:hypothetical protein